MQNNFTTPEQSTRLLELGVPADSADCYDYEGSIFRREYNELKDKFWDDDEMVTPCWSVGRLIEIYELLLGIPFTRYNLKISLLDEVLERYWQNKNQLDFSKLRE